jgi:hypothetical protein
MGYIFDKKGRVLENESTGEVPAWFAFGLDPSLARENQTFLKNRTISISFEGARMLVLVYAIDGIPVLSKRIPDTQWSCGENGLALTLMNNPHGKIDKFPGEVAVSSISTLYRVGTQLIVKIVESGHGTVLYVFPLHEYSQGGYRFEAVP